MRYLLVFACTASHQLQLLPQQLNPGHGHHCWLQLSYPGPILHIGLHLSTWLQLYTGDAAVPQWTLHCTSLQQCTAPHCSTADLSIGPKHSAPHCCCSTSVHTVTEPCSSVYCNCRPAVHCTATGSCLQAGDVRTDQCTEYCTGLLRSRTGSRH